MNDLIQTNLNEMKSDCKKFNRMNLVNANYLMKKTCEKIHSSLVWNKYYKIIDRSKINV